MKTRSDPILTQLTLLHSGSNETVFIKISRWLTGHGMSTSFFKKILKMILKTHHLS